MRRWSLGASSVGILILLLVLAAAVVAQRRTNRPAGVMAPPLAPTAFLDRTRPAYSRQLPFQFPRVLSP